MTHRAEVVLAACAVALLLASCASAPRAAQSTSNAAYPLTIELFDSRAVIAPPGPTAPIRLDLPPLPEYPIQAAASPTPAVEARVGAASAAPSDLPPVSPAADASLASPVRPTAKASFRLDAPSVPALAASAPARPDSAKAVAPRPAAPKSDAPKAVASKPTAPKPAPPGPQGVPPAAAASKQVASNPSSAATGGNTTGGNAAGGNAPASNAASGSSGGAQSSSASPAAPYGRLREIYARQGDELQIGLDGVGFLFLGLADSQADGMSFKSKENRANRTLFTFQALKLGTYDLDFLQQDNMAGKTSRETVRVHVVSDQDFAAATGGQAGQSQAPGQLDAGGTPAETGDPSFALKLAAAGSYPAAIAELLKGYREGNPGLNDQIAGLYLKMGSYDAAEKYWSRNLQPPSDFTPRAVVGLFRVSVLQSDQQAVLSYLKPFLALSDPSMEEPLVQAVRMEKARSETGIALDLAAEYSQRFPNGAWRDEVDFLTAQLLEADSPFRDIARAKQLYLSILADHPESLYAGTARVRVQYIDRHFLQVR